MEQEEYTKEEINWSYIEFIDNQDVLDLIEKVFSCCLTQSFNFRIWCFPFSDCSKELYVLVVRLIDSCCDLTFEYM